MRYFILSFFLFLAACAPVSSPSDSSASGPLKGTELREGFINLHVDETKNRIYADLPKADEDGVMLRFIHAARLTAGLGSNPVGLDRGWGEGGRIVVIRQMGDKIILEQENLSYRASKDNPLEERAVRESFARSFLATLPLIKKTGDGVIVDLTNFLTEDRLNLVQYLKDADQGSFSVAEDRTFVDVENSFSFPDNVEIDAFITLTSKDPGQEVATTAASGRDVTWKVRAGGKRPLRRQGFRAAIRLSFYPKRPTRSIFAIIRCNGCIVRHAVGLMAGVCLTREQVKC